MLLEALNLAHLVSSDTSVSRPARSPGLFSCSMLSLVARGRSLSKASLVNGLETENQLVERLPAASAAKIGL